jgi:cellobiose transport system permease protein
VTTSLPDVESAALLAPRPPRRRPSIRGRAPADSPARPLTYVVLAVTLVVFAFPLWWMFVVSSGTDSDLAAVPPKLLPGSHLGDNVSNVFHQDGVYFTTSLINSAVSSTVIAVSVMFFCSLAGFAFAKLRFRGRNVLFVLVLATLAVPPQLGIVPLYILMSKLGLTGQLTSVIFPGLVTAFGVFYMRQHISEGVPDELIEAARVDGASTLRIYRSIIVPSVRPAFGVLGLLTFLAAWNDFQWPLVTLSGGDQPTVQVALNSLASGTLVVYSHLLAGALLATLPLFVLFVVAGKQIVSGIMEGAVKT